MGRSSRISVVVLLIYIVSIGNIKAQHMMPDKGFDQFRQDLSEIEAPDEKLRKYLEASVRFSPRTPDTVFSFAEEVKVLEGLEPKKQNAYYYFILANAWRTVNKDSVVHYAAEATQKLRALGDHESYLRMENLLGLELSRQQEFLKADSVFKNAISYSQTLEKLDYPVNYFYGNLGTLYTSVGAHDLAIQMFERMLEMEDNAGNRCNIISKLAVSLSKINEHQRAVNLLSPCLEYDQVPPPIQSIVRSNLSRMYDKMGEGERALYLMEEAAAISMQNEVPNLEVSQLIELGRMYLENGKISRADSVRMKIEEIPLRKFTPDFIITKNIFFSGLELAHERAHQAINYSTDAIQTAERNNRKHILKNIYSTRANAFEKMGDLPKALENERLQAKLEEEMHNRETEKDLAMMSVRYQLQHKNAELLTISNELKTVKVRNALIILFLIIAALYFIYKHRIHFLLQEEKTRNRIARDLHDDLSGTLSSISFFSEAAKRMQPTVDAAGRYLQLIDQSAIEAKEKINDIIWAIDPTNDDWSVFLKKCKRYAADTFDSKEIEYEINIGEVFSAPMNLELRQNLWLIFKEMVNNLANHSEADHATINFLQEDKIIYLEVRDDGTGFNTEAETDHHGIKNIKHRAEQIKAAVSLKSVPGEGTVWKMELKA